jgi:hypothetical protein
MLKFLRILFSHILKRPINYFKIYWEFWDRKFNKEVLPNLTLSRILRLYVRF